MTESETRIALRLQLTAARAGELVACTTCGARILAWRQFRCLECGLFFCRDCAYKHFEMEKPDA